MNGGCVYLCIAPIAPTAAPTTSSSVPRVQHNREICVGRRKQGRDQYSRGYHTYRGHREHKDYHYYHSKYIHI